MSKQKEMNGKIDKPTAKVDSGWWIVDSEDKKQTELDPAAVGQLVEKLMAEGRADDVRKIRCWAHSHPRMDVCGARPNTGTSYTRVAD